MATYLGDYVGGFTSTHNITFTPSAAGSDVLVFAISGAVLTFPAGWVNDAVQLNTDHSGIWRLPGGSNGAGVGSVTVTTAVDQSVAAVVVQDYVTGAPSYDGWSDSNNTPINGGTLWGTGLHTWTAAPGGESSYAAFCMRTALMGEAFTGVGTSVTAPFALLGQARTALDAGNGTIMIVAQADDTELTNDGAVLTLDPAETVGRGADASSPGIVSYATREAVPPVDTDGPVVQSRTPAVDATGVAVGQTISATFDENLGGTPTISLSPSVTGTPTVSGATISFDPDSNLAVNTTYTVTITGIEDALGNTSPDVSWSFTTAAVTTQSIWYPATVPNTVAVDATDYAFVTEFTVAVSGTVTAVRMYKDATVTADWPAMTVYLGEKGGAVLATGTLDAGTETGWVTGALDSAVAVSPGNNYVVGAVVPAIVDYASQSSLIWPVVSGDITATNAGYHLAATTPQTGTYSTFNNSTYYIDLVFSTGATPPPSDPNPIVTENALPGAGETAGYVPATANGTIGYLGYSKQFSVNDGGTIEFAVDNAGTGTPVEIAIYRLGNYSHNGSNNQYQRLVTTITNTPTDQSGTTATTNSNNAFAMNWATTATWNVPVGAMSGLYVAAVRDGVDGNSQAWIPFIVRNDNRDADIVVKVSDSTWGAAYNYFGDIGSEKTGRDLYGIGPVGIYPDRTVSVSYDRPIVSRNTVINHWDVYELPLINYLEANGFDVKYISCYDLDQQGINDVLGSAKVLVNAGHDEYWSQGMWDNAEAFRDAGGHLLWLSANHVFWRIRYADNGRTIWCYKDTLQDLTDPVEWTGTWRDTRRPGGAEPESLLTGDFFRMNNTSAKTMTIGAGSAYDTSPFWRNTPVAAGSGLSVANLIGFEAQAHDLQVANGVLLADTTVNIDGSYADDNGQNYGGNGDLVWGIPMFYASANSGVTVSVGTMNWLWALSTVKGGSGGSVAVTAAIQQATANLLYDMGATAGTFDTNLTEPTPVSFEQYGMTLPQRSGIGIGEGGVWEAVVPPGGAWLYSVELAANAPVNTGLRAGDLCAVWGEGPLSFLVWNGSAWTTPA